MRITESNLQSQSSASSYSRLSRESALDVSVRRADTSAAGNQSPQGKPELPSTFVQLSSESVAAQTATSDTESFDPKLSLLISLIERLTGHKIRLFDAASIGNAQTTTQADAAALEQQRENTRSPQVEWSIHFESKTIHEEAEQANYQAKGSVTTADGRKIDFELGLTMQRYERTESSTTFDAGNAPKKKDPLVLNLSTDQVRLTGQTISFDLNLDGQNDKLAKLAAGSGYLVLDRNKNGKIDDGSELFGPTSGDGFSELSTLDSDGNGWIDENDAAFTALAVWRPGEGSSSLSEAGVGAIALDKRATPYTLKANGSEAGNVRTTGVFLTEEGEAKTIQQIDLVA